MTNLNERLISFTIGRSLSQILTDRLARKDFLTAVASIRLKILNDKRGHADIQRLYKTFISDTDFSYMAEMLADVESLLQDMGGRTAEEVEQSEQEKEEKSQQDGSESEAQASIASLLLAEPIKLDSSVPFDVFKTQIDDSYKALLQTSTFAMTSLTGTEWKLNLQPLPRYWTENDSSGPRRDRERAQTGNVHQPRSPADRRSVSGVYNRGVGESMVSAAVVMICGPPATAQGPRRFPGRAKI